MIGRLRSQAFATNCGQPKLALGAVFGKRLGVPERMSPSRDTPRSDTRILVSAAAVAIATWGIGLGVAASIGLAHVYLGSITLYVAAFGTAWSAFWFLWSVRHLPRMIDAAQMIVRDSYAPFADGWRKRFRCVLVLPVVSLWCTTFIYVGLAAGNLVGASAVPYIGRVWLDGPHLGIKLVVVALWAVVGILVFTVNVTGAIDYFLFVVQQSRLPDLGETIGVVREGHRRVARFGTITGLAWTFAAAVAIAAGFRPTHVTAVVVVYTVIFTAWGVVLLLLPELVFHRSLSRIADKQQVDAIRIFRDLSGRRPRSADLRRLDEELARIDAESTWLHGRDLIGLGALLAQLGLPAASLAISVLLHG